MTATAGELLLRDLLPPPVRPRTRVGRRWIDMSLRHKVLSVVALISLVCTPPIAVGLVVQDRLHDARQATRQTTDTVEALVVLEDMVLLRGHRAIVSFVISGFSDQAHADEFRSITADAPRLLAELAEDVPADLEVRLAATVAAYETELVSYGAVASSALPRSRSGQRGGAGRPPTSPPALRSSPTTSSATPRSTRLRTSGPQSTATGVLVPLDAHQPGPVLVRPPSRASISSRAAWCAASSSCRTTRRASCARRG